MIEFKHGTSPIGLSLKTSPPLVALFGKVAEPLEGSGPLKGWALRVYSPAALPVHPLLPDRRCNMSSFPYSSCPIFPSIMTIRFSRTVVQKKRLPPASFCFSGISSQQGEMSQNRCEWPKVAWNYSWATGREILEVVNVTVWEGSLASRELIPCDTLLELSSASPQLSSCLSSQKPRPPSS